MSQSPSSSNKLLAALSSDDYARVAPFLEPVRLSSGQVLYESNESIEYAYFPLNGVVSLLNLMTGGQRVEATMVGNEGMVGVPLILGTMHISMQAIVQIPGDALRIPAETFQTEIRWGSPLYSLLLRYTQTLMRQIAQNLACIRFHAAQERCCYLLSLTQDRLGSNELPLTHEVLSHFVGVRRDHLGILVQTLKRAGLIHHQRGKITILDRAGLEAAACDCYRILRSEFDRLLE